MATGPMGTEIYPVIVEFVLGEQGTGPELCRGDLREIALGMPSKFQKFPRLKLDRDSPQKTTWPVGLGERLPAASVSPCFGNAT